MSIKKNNTYFEENEGKIYYYDVAGNKKDVPATAFDNLQEQIENIGSPLVWIDILSADEINALTNVKNGSVYTLANDGIISGDTYRFNVSSGDEIAWTSAKNCWQQIGSTSVSGPTNSWKQWSENHNSSGDNDSVYIGKDLSAENGGIIIGDVGTQIELDGFDSTLTKTDNGIVITKAMKNIPSGVFEDYDFNYEYISKPSGALNFKYNEIEYNETARAFDTVKITDNTKWAASAANGGIAIGRAVTADFGGIAISPKFNSNNTNFNVLGTSASNEGVAIGEGVAATNGGLAFGKNGLSANAAAIGIGRVGSANNASVLISNDLRQTTAMSGQTYCYYDNNTNQYVPVDRTLGKHYYSSQYLNFNKYNTSTSAFESITGINYSTYSNGVYCILLNEYDGAVYISTNSYPSSVIISGYYDENKVFHEVPRESVPSTATFVTSHSASLNSYSKYASNANTGVLYTESFYPNSSYVFKLTYDRTNPWTNFKLYSDYRMSDIYNYLRSKPNLSAYIDETSLKNAIYDNIYYDDNPRSPTSGKLINESSYIDYLIGKSGEPIYLEDIVLTGVSAKFEPNNMATYNGIGIGQNLQTEASIVLNTNGNSYVGEISNTNKINSSNRYAVDIETGSSNYYNVLKENTFFDTGVIQSSATQPKAQGESILISPNGRNVYAYGESVLIGRKDTTATSRSIAIGNCQYASNASISIGYADENDNNYGIASAMCNSAYNKAIAIGTSNKSQNCSIVVGKYNNADYDSMAFGKYNTIYGDVYAIGERNSIYNGRSIVLGFDNVAGSPVELAILGFSNTAYGSSIQGALVGHKNYISLGSLQGILGGHSNSANGSSLQCAILGTENYCGVASIQGAEIGYKNSISCGSVRGAIIGVENTASMSNFDSVLIGIRNNFSYGGSDATVIGTSNTANMARGVIIGQQNRGLENPVLIGYNNKNNAQSQDVAIGNSNTVSNESFAFGNSNTATIGGHNVVNGLSNTASYESIAIGSYNNVTGHSLALGWANTTISGWYYDHALMFGYCNSATNNIRLLSAKNIDKYTYITYDPAEMDTAHDNYVNTYYAAANNNVVVFERYAYMAIYPWGTYFDFVVPKYYYDSTENALLPYNAWYNPDTYYVYYYDSSVYSRIQQEIRNGTISEAEAKRYVFVYDDDLFNNLISLVNNCDPITAMPYYTAYTAASATYFNMYNTNNTYQTSTAEADIETNSFIVGTNNKAEHYNSYLFGSYNQSLSAATSAGDDGFTVAVGLNNIVARNYDMAIGYGVLASGGENIAIGAPIANEYGDVLFGTKALGYKNLSIRSNVAGIANIAVDTVITGNIAEIFDGSNNREYDGLINDNNQYFNSNVTFNKRQYSNANISKNTIEHAKLTADVNTYFVHNNIIDLVDGYFYGSITHNDVIHNKDISLKTDYTSDGIEENIFLHNINLSAYVNEMSHNIFSHVSGSLSSQQSHNNLLFNSNINVSADNGAYRGFSNNFAQNSTIDGAVYGIGDSFFYSSSATYLAKTFGANNMDVLFFSRYITDLEGNPPPSNSVVGASVEAAAGQNFLFGTFGINLHSVFSFSDRQGMGYESYGPPTGQAFILNCCRVYNFGDNYIASAAYINCVGEANNVTGIKHANINGDSNYLITENNGDNSDYIGIYGQANNYIVSGYTTDVNYFTIVGNNNDAEAAKKAGRNIILGSCNSYHSVSASAFSGMNNLVNVYSAIVDNINYNYNIGTYVDDNYRLVGAPIHYSNRNTIVGQHSVISDGINDSVIVGSNNLIYNSVYETKGNSFRDTDTISNNYALGSYNLLKDGSNQVNIGVASITSGHNATACGEGLIANTSQIVVGRLNEELPGTNGLWDNDIDNTSGALFIVGNGCHLAGDFETTACSRSNAMIVSADGTVSAAKFATPQIPDIASAIGELSDLITLLQNKPATGSYIIGSVDGVLTWLSASN